MRKTFNQLVIEQRQQATKIFKARGSQVSRCHHCHMALTACFCAWKVKLSSTLNFIILLHPKELYKPTNTGRLICDLFPHSSTAFTWSRTNTDDALIKQLNDDSRQLLLLFPENDNDKQKMDIEQEHATESEEIKHKPLTLIVLDGTWKQAARMAKLTPYLQGIPRLNIASGPNVDTDNSINYVRKPLSDAQLSTAQAVAEALHLYGETDNAEALKHYFSIFNQHCLATRANKPPTITTSHHYLQNLIPNDAN
ncbi:MAG: tRNA-uridine aminocarboxypropyltransferase [Cellvibrionaceae bacterium]